MTTETSLSPVITVRGLAEYLRIHPSTVYRLLKHGLLPGFKVGSDWRFNREDIQRCALTGLGEAPAASTEEGRAPGNGRRSAASR